MQSDQSCKNDRIVLYSPVVINMKEKIKGIFALLFATLIWGTAFIAQSVGMDHIGPMTFQAVRCALAVVFLIPAAFLFDISNHQQKSFFKKWADPRLWKTGLICGFTLFVAAGLQQTALVFTSAGKAGFITAMYIVLVPVLGLFLKRMPSPVIWISVLLAVAGLYLLSCMGVSEINIGDVMLLFCALAFAVQITLIDLFAVGLDGIRLNCVQSFVCSALSAIVMFFTETPHMNDILSCWLPLCYAGILSMGVAYTLQIVGQQRLDPAPASLIMSLESVFAAVFAWLLLRERMSTWELFGCLLVFSAVILSQIPVKTKKKIGR